MRSPEAIFDSPRDVVDNIELSREQKIAVLHQWKDETVQRQAADSEAMPGSTEDVELLQQITNALIALDDS